MQKRLLGSCILIVFYYCHALGAWAVTLTWVPIGNPGNPPDTVIMNDGTTGYGRVDSIFNISKFETTNAQYTEFLNAKDPTGVNVLGLSTRGTNPIIANLGIAFNPNSPDGSKYAVISGRENLPVNGVTWYSAIRFANWLNNGQGNGDTETVAYTLLGGTQIPSNGDSIVRNPGATVFLPSEDEWYKAAYFNPKTNSYFLYPTSSNAPPNAELPPGGINSANWKLVAPLPLMTNVRVRHVKQPVRHIGSSGKCLGIE